MYIFHIKRIVILVASLLWSSHTLAETSEVLFDNLSDFVKNAEQIVQPYVDQSWFSGNVLLASKSDPLSIRSYGMSNIANKVSNSRCTRFNIGSIAKHYTAVLVLQMIEQGKLSYDTKLSEFDIGIDAEIAAKVSIEQLLKHRAGFGDIFIPAYMNDPLSYDSLEKKVALLKDQPLLSEPGTEYRYSNYGYILLGTILERITGKSFASLLKDRIFSPIGAQDSSLRFEASNPCQSEAYTFALDKSQKPSPMREVAGPDGGIQSTVDDVYKFFSSLFFTDQLLKRDGDAFKRFFGKGTHHGSYGGGTGVSAAAEVLRDQHMIIVVLANSDELVAERISTRLAKILRQKPIEEFRLPAKHFVYDKYKALGLEHFKRDFPELFKANGYQGFMGRPLNEAGLNLAKNGNSQEAYEIVSTLSYFYPEAPQAYDSLAYVHYLLGDTAAARREFEKARELSAGFNSDYHLTNYDE